MTGGAHHGTGAAGRMRVHLRLVASIAIMSVGATAMLVVGVLTLFRTRRFQSEVMARALGRLILRLWGVRLAVRAHAPVPEGQVVYVSNHTSTLDLFALIALGLPRTRFFLSGFLRRVVPLGVIGYLIGIFWTVRQDRPQRRVQIFQRADRILRHTGDSVYLSPEGERVTGGEIGRFNRGAFHLATSLGAPIVPLFLVIPPETDPGRGYAVGAGGTLEVHVMPAIETAHWRVEDVDHNRELVRQRFVEWNAALRGRSRTAPDRRAAVHRFPAPAR
jgi:1-acyl-sn-glycerol-3-phosphate acyltransferase